MKLTKNNFTNTRQYIGYLLYSFISFLVITLGCFQGATDHDSHEESYTPMSTNALYKEIKFKDHIWESNASLGRHILVGKRFFKEKYSVYVKSAPALITLEEDSKNKAKEEGKEKEDYKRVVAFKLNKKLLRLATKKDPFIVRLKNIKYTYRRMCYDPGQEPKFVKIYPPTQKVISGPIELKISIANKNFINDSREDTMSFMHVNGTLMAGFTLNSFAAYAPTYDLSIAFNNPSLEVRINGWKRDRLDNFFKKNKNFIEEEKKECIKNSRTCKYLETLNQPIGLHERKDLILSKNILPFTISIDEITVDFPKAETEKEPIKSILQNVTTGIIFTSIIGGGITAYIKKARKKKQSPP